MRPRSSIALARAAALLTLAAACAGPRPPEARTVSDDRAAIERLHQADMRAVLAGDADALIALWTDDIVALPPDGPARVGRDANAAALRRALELGRDLEPLGYRLEFEEVTLLGDHALEWGRYRGRVRPRAGGAEVALGGKVMRLLRRQADGSWRVARTMYTADPPPAER